MVGLIHNNKNLWGTQMELKKFGALLEVNKPSFTLVVQLYHVDYKIGIRKADLEASHDIFVWCIIDIDSIEQLDFKGKILIGKR